MAADTKHPELQAGAARHHSLQRKVSSDLLSHHRLRIFDQEPGPCIAFLLGSFALWIEGCLDSFSILRAFDLIMGLAVLDTFHGFQAVAGSEIFLCGGADCGRQFVVINSFPFCIGWQSLLLRRVEDV